MGKGALSYCTFVFVFIALCSCSTSTFVVDVTTPPSIEIPDDINRMLMITDITGDINPEII